MNPATVAPDEFGAFRLDERGWLDGARHARSPNFDARPQDAQIELLVIHNISLPPGAFGSGDVERLFTNRLDARAHPFFAALAGLRVSSHFLVERTGRVTQFVSCLDRAWHAGASCFEGRAECNDFSVGIELEGSDFGPFEAAQYKSLAPLVRELCARFAPRAVRGHQHIAVDRKTDPGPFFEWQRLAIDATLPIDLLPDTAR
jgi:N-acetyl-anhydromuramoyl-L-alanine amidase